MYSLLHKQYSSYNGWKGGKSANLCPFPLINCKVFSFKKKKNNNLNTGILAVTRLEEETFNTKYQRDGRVSFS